MLVTLVRTPRRRACQPQVLALIPDCAALIHRLGEAATASLAAAAAASEASFAAHGGDDLDDEPFREACADRLCEAAASLATSAAALNDRQIGQNTAH